MNKEYLKWLNSDFISKEDKEILSNMCEEEINDSFNEELVFGTAGIRGLMGLGISKLNKYTIGKVTLGLSNYLNKKYKNPVVVIGYDTRNNSREFAFLTTAILNHEEIKTFISKDISSTPFISFSTKYLNANAGIVITASHNPKDYNGYKVYLSTGGQIVSPIDKDILKEINLVDYSDVKEAPISNPLFNYIDKDVVDLFNKENEKVIINKELIEKYAKDLRVTYTSFHGTGIRVVPFIFEKYGIRYNLVNEQCKIDSNFTFAPYPNPEVEENFVLSKEYAKELNSDVIISTDPDSDRIGILYKEGNDYKLLNGNMIGCVFLYYLLNNIKVVKGNYVVRSIVSTTLFDKIADYYQAKVVECLTGCKNISSKKNSDPDNFVFGFEESLGYMFNIDVNDKNAFSSIIFFLEILCYLKSKNMTMSDYIEEIFNKFGYYEHKTLSITFKNLKEREKLMDKLRKNNIFKAKEVIDFLNLKELKSNTLKYILNDHETIMIRPSGTEPKLKVYLIVNDIDKSKSLMRLDLLIDKVNKELK
jgi:phosphoglucomutase